MDQMMFLLDDVVMSPFRGILAIFREIHNAVMQESMNEAAAVRAELGELYILLEQGSINENEFEKRESALLDRLDALETPESDKEDQGE